MLEERSLRRTNFLGGIPVTLADGQRWSLPMPPDEPGEDSDLLLEMFGPDYEELMEAIAEADDETDLLRLDLALSILLLARNYDLAPDALTRLLCFPDRDDLARMRRASRPVLMAHVRAWDAERSASRRRNEAFSPLAAIFGWLPWRVGAYSA